MDPKLEREDELLDCLSSNLDTILELLPANAYDNVKVASRKKIRKAASDLFAAAHQIYGIAHELRNRLVNYKPPSYRDALVSNSSASETTKLIN